MKSYCIFLEHGTIEIVIYKDRNHVEMKRDGKIISCGSLDKFKSEISDLNDHFQKYYTKAGR